MSATITPSVDADRLARLVHGERTPEQLRTSERRRQRLERWARTMAEAELTLELDPEHGRTAAVTLVGEHPRIRIPSWELPQPITDFERTAYDYLMQRTLTLHEIGHVRYTDQDAVDAVVEQVASERREFFHHIWNALEDGAIEEQLRHEFAVADELAVMNANFGAAGAQGVSTYGIADAIITGCLDLAVYDSGRLASLLDPADGSIRFEDDDERTRFVEDVLPELRSAAVDVVTEGDPETRAERVLELWRELVSLLDIDSVEPPQLDHGGKGDHAGQENGSGERAGDLDSIDRDAAESFVDGIGEPDDPDTRPDADSGDGDTGDGGDDGETSDKETGTNHGEGAEDAEGDAGNEDASQEDTAGGGDEGPGGDHDGMGGDHDGMGDDDDGEAHAGDTGVTDGDDSSDGDSDSSGGDRPSNGSDSGSDDDGDEYGERDALDESSADSGSGGTGVQRSEADPTDSDDGIERTYEELVREQQEAANEVTDDARREYESIRRALERIQDEGESPHALDIAEAGQFRSDAWPDTKRTGKKLERILTHRLREEERSGLRRGLRSGRIEPRLLTRIKRRDVRIFRKRETPDEKKYAAVLIVDRSGSMGRKIHATEEATTALCCALSSLDVETCVLDVGGRTPQLAKPFGIAPEESLEHLLTGEYGGSTPLSPALRIARERLEMREEFPFVIVLTDGVPNDEHRYRNELERCPFPVLGVYLNFGGSADPSSVDQDADLFDRRRIVTGRGRLETELRTLCQGVMF